MTALSQRLVVVPALGGAAWRLALPLGALHAAMFVYDLAHPGRFVNADRAGERIQVVAGFGEAMQSGDPLAYLTRHGIVGDWLPQALLYAAGGQYFVIAAQVLLALASVLWVREIGLRLGLRESAAQGAALLYALLPHTLVFPHQLASEAISVPLVILAFRLAAGGAGLAIGLATLVRPITALWPLIHVFAKEKRRAYLLLAFAPLLAWMSIVFVATGEFSMGRSGHDLGNNIYYRLQRIGGALPPAERPAVRPDGETKATLGEYVAFAVSHPAVMAKYAAIDMAVMGFKSGIERLVLDYLYLYPAERSELKVAETGWRSRVDSGGAGALLELARQQPVLIATATTGALAFTLLMLFAVYGAARWARSPERLALVAFVIYIFATTQAVDAAQSRLRAPAEFAICLLAIAGWQALKRRARRHGG